MQQLFIAIILAGFSLGAFSEATDASFYTRNTEGWFFYNELFPAEEQLPEEQAPKPSKPEKIEPLAEIEPAPQAPAGPPAFSAQWMRENLDKYRDVALDNPTHENVQRYFYLQKVVMDKASRFSDMARRVTMGDHNLDENNRRPLMTAAARNMDAQAKDAREVILKDIAATSGLFFFFSGTCQYCVQQSQILANLERVYGFDVLPVSIDGGAMPNGLYPDFKIDQGQATILGVEQTPSLFLFREPDQFIQLSQGIVSMEEFSERVMYMAEQAGWIDKGEFNRTRKHNPGLISADAGNGITEQMLKDPVALAKYLQSQVITR